jgi:hypothetical protein
MSNAVSSVASSISWGGSAIASTGNVNANATRDTIEVTPIGVDFKSVIFAPQNWTVTVEVFLNKTDHAGFQTDWQARTKKELVITWDTGWTWTGDAYITSLDVTAAVSDAIRATVTFQSHGEAVTFA